MSKTDGARPAVTRLARVNLNLLVALDALLSEVSVTGAAGRIGISQSAMSHSLAQLRAIFGDPLIVRSSGGARLTENAMRLVAPLRRTLYDFERLLAGAPAFEATTSDRDFHLAAGDSVSVLLLPEILKLLAAEAPGVSVSVRAPDARRMLAELEAGDVEIYVVARPPDSPGLRKRKLLDETFVCVARKDHPSLREGLDLQAYTQLSHVLVTPQGSGPALLDALLAERGLARRIALRVPYFLAAPMIVAESDLILTLPQRYAERLADRHGLSIHPPPLDLPGFSMSMVWHERLDADPASAWFRDVLVRAAERA